MNREKIYEATEFENIKEMMYETIKKYKTNIAFTLKYKEEKDVRYEDITYEKFLEEVNNLGTKLFDLGYNNKRIAVVGKNRYEWVLAHVTNLLGGIVSVPLDKDMQFEELESCLQRSKADMVIFDEKQLEKIEEIKKRNNTNLKEYVCMSKIDNYLDIETLKSEGEKLLKSGNKDYINAEIDSYKMGILLFTSGTTSRSKAVMLSQKNIACNVYALQCVEDLRPTDTNIAFLPLHHVFGSTCIIWTLSGGVRHVFPDGLRYIKQNLNEYKVSVFVGVPLLIESIYRAIMKEVEKQGKAKVINIAMKISNLLLKLHIDIRRKIFKQILDALGGELRFVVSGGAPADPKISKAFTSLGVRTLQGYGLTETAPVIAGEDEKHIKYGTVGLPMINDTIEIDNPDEKGIGEIKVKGPNVMLGYYEMPEETAKVLRNGWFYTGDLGTIDKKGYLTIVGRNKDMIVLKNGKKAFPEEIEIIINRLDEVEECMVFGMPDKKDKSNIKLSVKVVYNKEVVKEKYPDADEKELENIIWEKIKEINKTLPTYKYIKHMILTDKELIKTTTKKIKRNEEMKLMEQ